MSNFFYPSTNIVSNPDLACYHLCLSNLEWTILPKSILGHKVYKLFPQAILAFVISLWIGFYTTKVFKRFNKTCFCINWSSIEILLVVILHQEISACGGCWTGEHCSPREPYFIELASLAGQQKLLYFLKHLVHRSASTVSKSHTTSLTVERWEAMMNHL